MIGDDIKITLVRIAEDKCRLGIEAPRDIPVHRLEIFESLKKLVDANNAKFDPTKGGGSDA